VKPYSIDLPKRPSIAWGVCKGILGALLIIVVAFLAFMCFLEIAAGYGNQRQLRREAASRPAVIDWASQNRIWAERDRELCDPANYPLGASVPRCDPS